MVAKNKIWTVQIQIDREILEDLGPNSVPQKEFTMAEIMQMENLAYDLSLRYERFGFVRMQSEIMKSEEEQSDAKPKSQS